ncbi:MAG: hypothetical protein Q9224_001928 [Gallowayella concinna]
MSTSSDPAAEVTYTPTTHRISKAKKGKKVHVCEYPGCGKPITIQSLHFNAILKTAESLFKEPTCWHDIWKDSKSPRQPFEINK